MQGRSLLHRQKNTSDAIGQVEKMSLSPKEKKRTRTGPRNPTDAIITCRPYASSGATPSTDGIMRNFSCQGSYIEMPHQFMPGTILLLRILRFPTFPRPADEERPRSICLAEVKWQRELTYENTVCFGMGLKYLN